MKDNNNKYRFAKKELGKIAIPIVVLFIVSLSYYFYMRHDTLRGAKARSEVALENAEKMILVRLGKIQTVVNSLQPLVEYALDDPDAMFDIARHTMESSSRIMGSGIAFKEDYYPQKGHWYEIYVGHQAGCDTLVAQQVGSAEHDYFQMEWYRSGLAAENGVWSNPYYDNVGGKSYMMSYAVPIHDESGEVVGVIGADITIDTLANIVRSIKPYPHSFCTLTAGDGTVLVEAPAAPKGRYKVFTEEIDDKNLTLTIIVPYSDMYGRLWRSTIFFVFMALTGILSVFFIAYRSLQNLWKLNEVRIKEQHIEDELSIARDIQRSLLPTGASSIPKVDVCGLQIPAKYVGGDLYDYYVRGNKLFFCIGDVSGKGVPAALLMAISHSLFRTLSAHDESPESIMKSFNAAINDNNSDMMFITMFLGILDMETGTVRYCNAGHNPPIIIRNGKPEFIDTKPSLLMGIEPNATYTSHTLELAPGDSLFLYTDGLTEAENERKELFGEERALTVAAGFGKLTAEEQVQKMREAMHLFVDHAEQSDDLTLLVVRRPETSANATLTLTNNINDLERLEPFLEEFFQQNGLSLAPLSQIDLALEEALANVIMYAYPEGTQGEVTLSMKVESNAICMEISDSGVPFNPLQQQEANLDVPLEERKIGGLGIHLIKEIMDSMTYEYHEGRNVLRMIFTTEINEI